MMFSFLLTETTRYLFVSNSLPWKHLVKKFIGLVFFTLQLSCSFIDNSLQVVCVFFHHREHVVYYTDGSERKKGKQESSKKISRGIRVHKREKGSYNLCNLIFL